MHCSVYAGHIRANRVSLAEAVRFVQTLRMGGYDIVKMATEHD